MTMPKNVSHDVNLSESAQIGVFLNDPPAGALQRLMRVLRYDRRAMVIAFGGTIVASLVSLLQPWIVSKLVASMHLMSFARLAPIAAALVGAALVSSLITAGVNLVAARAGNRTIRGFRDESAEMALRVPAEKLVDHPAADLVARCSIDSEKMGEVFTHGPIQALGSIVLVSGALIQMTVIDPFLTISAVALTVLCFVMIVVASKRLTGISYDRQEAQGAYVAECTRALASVLTLRAFVANMFAIRRLAVTSKRLQDAANRSAKANAFMGPLVTMAIQATMLIIVCIAFVRVQNGQLPVAELVAFFMYTMMMVGPIVGSTDTVMLMAETLGALQRIVDLRTVVQPSNTTEVTAEELAVLQIYDREPKGDPDLVHGQVSFRNVSVKYAHAGGGREFALQDVSFDIPSGAWVALTGSSGSGKSTMLSLLERFIVPSQGLVLVDGIPLNRLFIIEGVGRVWFRWAGERRVGWV